MSKKNDLDQEVSWISLQRVKRRDVREWMGDKRRDVELS